MFSGKVSWRVHTFYFLLFVLFSLLLGCSQNNQKHEDVQLRAYRLIDDNNVDQAILLLIDEIKSRNAQAPNHKDNTYSTKELKVTLASAYMKKAGISIKEIAVSFQLAKNINSFRAFNENEISKDEANASKNLKNISTLFATCLRLAQAILIIPHVADQNIIYLKQATKVISSCPNLDPEDYIYSAIIKIILVRSMLESENHGDISPKIEKQNKVCVTNLSDFRDYLTGMTPILSSAYQDVAKAIPDRSEEMKSNINKITVLSDNLKTANFASIVVSSLQNESLNPLYVFLGIGNEIRSCVENEN